MSTVLKNKMPQVVMTLVKDPGTPDFVERRVPPRGSLEVDDELSSLTQAQIKNGVLKAVNKA